MRLAAVSARTSSFRKRAWLVLAALLACIAGGVYATNYSLWIHGRNGRGAIGNYQDFTYWGPDSVNAGVNKRAVNWDGRNRISATNSVIRDALDCHCTGSNWCYIAAHSAGDNQIGYALSLYGGSTREVKNPDASCTGTGATQTGWNIKWVDVASGAGGGSELADNGDWLLSEPLVNDLVTTNARALYNHNVTASKWFYMFAGAKGTLYSGILPGQDDEVVSYHSTGGVSGSSGGSYCNPSDWFCNDLTLGTNACEGGRAKWSFHTVDFRDDGETVNHYANGNWGGIVGKVRADVAAYAL